MDDDMKRKEALAQRKMIERKFGEAKKWHGMGRARYRGKWRVAIQVLMTFLVMNIKRIVKLILAARASPELA
jgi:IS5 family transposase